MSLLPFFTYFGGKWRSAPMYPAPEHSAIVEPFAGSAGYSLRYFDRRVTLIETNEAIAGVWRYLIRTRSEEILALPDLLSGQVARDLPVCQEAQWLIGLWLNKGSAAPCQKPSAWMRSGIRPSSFWGAAIRRRVASQVDRIRHWRIIHGDHSLAPDIEATWFIDPPYQVAGKHYPHGAGAIDFGRLADWSRSRAGQVIVCENAGATWMPFRFLASTKATPKTIRVASSGVSNEVIWTNIESAQRDLFDAARAKRGDR